MANIHINIFNESTVLEDKQVQPVVAALQKQVSHDFAPAWGIDASVSFVPKATKPAGDTWWIAILDNSDQAGALGYHDLTNAGLPLGKVFAGTDLQYHLQWSVTASHELLEMLGDPDINLAAYVEDSSGAVQTLYAYEVCDACEDDSFGYSIDGVLVSDFVFPSWFESFRKPNSARFDFQKKITQPFQLLKGGYIGVYQVTSGHGWKQKTASTGPREYRMRPPVGSRRERRSTPRESWMLSTANR